MFEDGTDWTSLLWLLGALLLVSPAIPRVIRNPRALHFIALWLAIAVALALIYRFFVAA